MPTDRDSAATPGIPTPSSHCETDPQDLCAAVGAIFERFGVAAADAAYVAESLVDADMEGVRAPVKTGKVL
ncbi:hypothetical protein AB4Y44_40970 [Paraburkholderia sp. BR10937]|uniref:hypothetical protein n=1 Tax=Paraburkholderia sp. BR10937 TaxID=3236994 RepID=UPI0034D290A5